MGLDERAGAVVTDGRLTSVGFEPVRMVGVDDAVDDVVNVRQGDSITLAP